MVKFEIKKVFCRTSARIALLLLLAVLGVTCFLAMDVSYINENGDRESGKIKSGAAGVVRGAGRGTAPPRDPGKPPDPGIAGSTGGQSTDE